MLGYLKGALDCAALFRIEGSRTDHDSDQGHHKSNQITQLQRISDALNPPLGLSYIVERIGDQSKRVSVKSGFAYTLGRLVLRMVPSNVPMSSATKNEKEMAIVASKRCLRFIRIAILLWKEQAQRVSCNTE